MKSYTGNTRAPFHDYHSPSIYMITLRKLDGISPFSKIVENDGRFHSSGKAIALHYPIGKIIRFSFEDFHAKYPFLEFWQQMIMPDHVHFILNVKTKLEEHLGNYIARFKAFIKNKAEYKGLIPKDTPSMFEEGYNDQYLRVGRSLQDLYDYIADNPSRLWEIWQHPENFRRINSINLGGKECRIYGNISLLKNPFITPVLYHRNFSQKSYEYHKKLWRYPLHNGGVLISPFIHTLEKEMLHEAIQTGGKVIIMNYIPDNDKWKPNRQYFDMCTKGQLLIISPLELEEYVHQRKDGKVTRAESLFLNDLSSRIAEINKKDLGSNIQKLFY